MKQIDVIAKFKNKIEQGELEVWEDEKGMVNAIDILCGDTYDGDYPPQEGYIPLFEFLRLTYPKITVKHTKSLLKEISFTEMWVYVEDNDDWWAYTNHKCNTCKKSCKQSSKVEILACPQYEAV